MTVLYVILGLIAICYFCINLERDLDRQRSAFEDYSSTYSWINESSYCDLISEESLLFPAGRVPLPRNPKYVILIQGNERKLTHSQFCVIQEAAYLLGYSFVYYPLYVKNLTRRKLSYNFPFSKRRKTRLTMMSYYKEVADSLSLPLIPASRYLVKFDTESGGFKVWNISPSGKKQKGIECYALASIRSLGDFQAVRRENRRKKLELEIAQANKHHSNVRMAISNPEKEKEFFKRYQESDERFETDQSILAEDARQQVRKWLMSGLERELIISWLYEDVIVSRLRVTKSARILLPDYGNMEIKMTPLEKTVYLFFLKNPDGYRFKELPEHRDEIRSLYGRLSRSGDTAEMDRSIDNLVNPSGPSISEKCAKIKAKFIVKIPEAIAENYLILGKQGEAKKISLDRKMVEWEKPSDYENQ